MVKVLISNTKHITIANIYIPPRDSTSTHYKTADTDIQHCIQYIANIPHSVLTGDVNTLSTLWHSFTDDHRGQLIADVISNSDPITLNTNTPTRMPNTTLQETSSPRCLTQCTTGTLWTTQYALSSPQLSYAMPTDYNKTDGLSTTTRKLTGHNSRKTLSLTQTTILTDIYTANRIVTNIILMADKHIIPKGKMHSNCRILPDHIV